MRVMQYNTLDTQDKLRWFDSLLMEGDKPRYQYLAYDTETNGLDTEFSQVVGFSISYDQSSGFYVPLLKWVPDESTKKRRRINKEEVDVCERGHLQCIWTGRNFDEFVTPKEYDIQNSVPIIPLLVKRWLSQCNLLMWNAPFDILITESNFGVTLTDNLWCDGGLLVHALDENYSVALKNNAEKYKDALGINPHALAAQEKKELTANIISNGGKSGEVWRASLDPQSKYACADTRLTYGIIKAAMQKFQSEYGQSGLKWFFEDEVMPVCKEVVIPMKRKGVYIDVPHFERLAAQNEAKLEQMEDSIIDFLTQKGLLEGFSIGKPIDKVVTVKVLAKKLFELENITVPYTDVRGVKKASFTKKAILYQYNQNPHWVYGWLLGEDEIKYPKSKLDSIKRQIYVEKEGRRHHFNIRSSDHLRWLFCQKLGYVEADLPQTDSATIDNPIAKMDEDVLQEYFVKDHEWVLDLIAYRKLSKIQSTYTLPALRLHRNGWLRMEMKQNGTVTGRFACSGGFNLMTLPRVDDELESLESCKKCSSRNVKAVSDIEAMCDVHCTDCGHIERNISRPSVIKRGFIAPPGYKIVNADYSSLEPRIFAEMSNEQSLKDVYLRGLDMYSQMYCVIFDKEGKYSADPKDANFLKKVAKNLRTFMKPIALAIPYGAEEAQVAILANAWIESLDKDGKVERKPDYEEGRRIMEEYFSGLPNLAHYMVMQDHKAMTVGVVETLFGRKRHLDTIKAVCEALKLSDITYADFKQARRRSLGKKSPSILCADGIKRVISDESWQHVLGSLGLSASSVAEKGHWLYLRNKCKSDLNNAKNTPIQGTAGHITNRGMLECNRLYKQRNLDAWVCLQVHDEITSYAAINDADSCAVAKKIGMEDNIFAKKISIPMIADPIICDNMMEAK